MKELDALMEALHERKIIERIRFVAKIVPLPKDCENKQERINKAVRGCLMHEFAENDDLNHLFCDFVFECGMERLLKEIDVKPNEKEAGSIGEALKNGLEELFNLLK